MTNSNIYNVSETNYQFRKHNFINLKNKNRDKICIRCLGKNTNGTYIYTRVLKYLVIKYARFSKN